MIIAHLSDLHISRFGTSLTQTRALSRAATEGDPWETIREEAGGWRIQALRATQSRLRWKDRLRLVDPSGIIHDAIKIKKGEEEQSVAGLVALMERRQRVSAGALAASFPSAQELAALLAEDWDNGNLRFCAVAHQLRRDAPDWLLVTGDLTDDAEGFELIEAGFAPFIEARRLVCIPGNHDIYPSPPLVTSPSARKTEAGKRRLWGTFAARVGMPAGGSHVAMLGPSVALACLDSCHPPRIPASASGLVQLHELPQVVGALDTLAGAEGLRLACLHHHITNPPRTALGSSPFQPGMRLRNARSVLEALSGAGVSVIMNGHRHLGYRYQPAGGPLFLSAPSTTMGCQSGQPPFYWQINVGPEGLGAIREVPIEALAAR